MEVIERLREQSEARKDGIDYRTLKVIIAGNYKLSIQGSNSYYCSPRKALKVTKYSLMEIAIFNNDETWSSVNNAKFNSFKRIEELRERGDGDMVCGYVPVDLIEDFYQYLKTIQ